MKTTSNFIFTCVAALAVGAASSALAVNTIANGDWDSDPLNTGNLAIWDSTFPAGGDTAFINNNIFVDRADNEYYSGYIGYDTTPADVVVNAGGSLQAWFGIFNAPTVTFNGGTIAANQRTHVLTTNSLTVNDVPGNVWTQFKNQTSKHARIVTPALLGDGTLDIQLGRAGGTSGQLFELNVDDTTGFTGELNVSRLGYDLATPSGFTYRLATPNAETNVAHLKINQSIAKENASFSIVLNEYAFDWTEANGGTAATDDGTAYNGYDIRDGNVEVWLTGLTIGGFEVPGRETAYTAAELIALDANIANYLRSDGSDGLLGVVPGDDPGGLAGDFNGDGTVDAADYTLYADNLGQADESAFATGTGDGINGVDPADYALWRSNFGNTTPPLLGGGGGAVPEPGTIALLAGGLGLGFIALRKNRK